MTTPQFRRRSLLKALSGAAISAASPQAISAALGSLGAANRQALVIGNGSYPDSPLKNPVNDASALAKSLTACGFQTELLVNAKRDQLARAITNYGARLAQGKTVGLFFYAGHGVQLAWRNYLIPTDALVERLEDLPKQCIELNSLLQVLNKAANPMNIIILDACRDNPFGTRLPPEQRGLSQFDAPPGSLLSYATAPGNTASDGTGNNGLFTENLLREMTTEGAKVEDVFKRVRLNVRLQSKGLQVPWESTSLEEDFYFVPPKQLAGSDTDQQTRRFEAEQAIWEKALAANTTSSLEDYLRRYPSGQYSELAQVRLDRLLAQQGEKKAIAVNTAANPFTKGSASGAGRYTVGDTFSFVRRDLFTKIVEKEFTDTVTSIADDRTVFNNGSRVVDLLGNEIKSQSARFLSMAQFFPAEYTIGQKWSTRFGWKRGDGVESEISASFKITGREPVKTAAGQFNAFIVEGVGYVDGGSTIYYRYLIDPDKCSRALLFEIRSRKRNGKYGDTVETELTSFSQAALAAR